MTELAGKLGHRRAVAEVGMRALDLVTQHSFKRKVLKDRDDVREAFVKRENVRITGLMELAAAGDARERVLLRGR